MKKTVRVVSLIVVIALALLVLTGCSDTPTVSGTKADIQSQLFQNRFVYNTITVDKMTEKSVFLNGCQVLFGYL